MNVKILSLVFAVFLCVACQIANQNDRENYYPELIQISLEDGKEIGFAKYPITIEQYSYFVAQSGYQTDSELNADKGCWGIRENKTVGWLPNEDWNSNSINQDQDHPVVCVSWNDAIAYTDWLSSVTGDSYRLPYTSEWELAANEKKESRFYFGDEENDVCKYINHADINFLAVFGEHTIFSDCDDGYGETSPVGTYPPNENGLFDLYGNVWEWQLDCVNEERNLEARYCGAHALKGASYASNPTGIVVGYKIQGSKDMRTADYGFRVVKEKR